jgi:hypothetical protein
MNDLEKFTLCEENLENIRKICRVSTTSTHDGFQIPADQDTLFWCFYFMSQPNSFDTIKTKHTAAQEKQLKIELVEELGRLKASPTVCAQIANDRKIDLKSFVTLCNLRGLSVILINKKTFINITTTCKNYFTVKATTESVFGYKEGADLDDVRQNYYEIISTDKPVKGISAYKVDELTEICRKLELSVYDPVTKKKKNKADLYAAFVEAMPLLYTTGCAKNC